VAVDDDAHDGPGAPAVALCHTTRRDRSATVVPTGAGHGRPMQGVKTLPPTASTLARPWPGCCRTPIPHAAAACCKAWCSWLSR